MALIGSFLQYVLYRRGSLAFKKSIRPLLNLHSNLDRMRYNRNASYFLDYQVHLMPYHDLYTGRPPPRMLVVLSIFHNPTRLDLSSPANSTILFPLSTPMLSFPTNTLLSLSSR